jgi:hypothetical protein
MNSGKFRFAIRLLVAFQVLGLVWLFAACKPKESAAESTTGHIESVMRDERDALSTIVDHGAAGVEQYGANQLLLSDDQFDYIVDQEGFISRVIVHSEDPFSEISENQTEYKTRALNLHQRNLQKWLKGDYSITEKQNPMGDTEVIVSETIYGNPSGRTTIVHFSQGGALMGFVSLNKAVAEDQLNQKENITSDQAAAIVLADVLKDHGAFIVERELSEVEWTAEKTTLQQHIVWRINMEHLTRTDFPPEGDISNWGVMFAIDVFTGEIIMRSYQG